MNKKLIAAAVTSALAVPAVASAADSEVSVYGRINNAIQYTDKSGQSGVWGLRNVVSRIGMRAKSDLGNGLSAIGRYEFFTYTNQEGQFDSVGGKGRGGINDTRLGYVGLSGAWGAVTIGNQWSAFYDTVGTHLDPTYSLGYFLYSSVMGGPYRTSNTVKYANTFGPVYLELDVRMSQNDQTGANVVPTTGQGANADEEVLGRDSGGNEDEIDGTGLGISWAIGDNFTLAGVYDVDKKPVNDNKRTAVAAKYTSGAWFASAGWYQIDRGNPQFKDDMWQLWLGGTFGKTTVQAGYGKGNMDSLPDDPVQFTLGVYHNMGGGFRLYYEGALIDAKNSGAWGSGIVNGDGSVHLFGMRYDFST